MGIDGVKAVYNGHSGLYDYKGQELLFSDKEEILQWSIKRDEMEAFRARFPFQNDADSFEIQ
jgi:hypothetical protein